jgi:hypothetical protein
MFCGLLQLKLQHTTFGAQIVAWGLRTLCTNTLAVGRKACSGPVPAMPLHIAECSLGCVSSMVLSTCQLQACQSLLQHTLPCRLFVRSSSAGCGMLDGRGHQGEVGRQGCVSRVHFRGGRAVSTGVLFAVTRFSLPLSSYHTAQLCVCWG